jgi:hypothetical protein
MDLPPRHAMYVTEPFMTRDHLAFTNHASRSMNLETIESSTDSR